MTAPVYGGDLAPEDRPPVRPDRVAASSSEAVLVEGPGVVVAAVRLPVAVPRAVPAATFDGVVVVVVVVVVVGVPAGGLAGGGVVEGCRVALGGVTAAPGWLA